MIRRLFPAPLLSLALLAIWLVLNREYAEDPVYFTLVPQPSFAARRTTLLVFHRRADGSVERLAVNRYPLGAPYSAAWAGGDLVWYLTEGWRAGASTTSCANNSSARSVQTTACVSRH